jgi:hypothetical protein
MNVTVRWHRALALALALAIPVAAGCSSNGPKDDREIAGSIVELYDWDPSGWHADQIWRGYLVLDHVGCAYLDVTHRADVELSEGDRPIRSFLRLPLTTTTYDQRDETLRVGNAPEVSPGDYVAVLGVQGWRQESNQKGEEFNEFHRTWRGSDINDSDACLAHVSFWVAWMGPSTRHPPDLPSSPPPIAGMIQTDDSLSSNAVSDWGVLEIEGRCTYLWLPDDRTPLHRRETPEFFFVRDGIDTRRHTPTALRRTFVRLGQPEVAFTVETRQLRVRGGEPMTTGDLVEVGGVLSDGYYLGLDHYIEECHASSVIAPSFMHLCTPEPESWPGFCEPSGVQTALNALSSYQLEPDMSGSPTVTEDFYMEQYRVTRPQARHRLARIPVLQALLDEVLEIEMDRIAGLAVDHYDTFGAWVWLKGDDAPSARTVELVAANADLELRTGAAHSYFELRDASDEVSDILGLGPTAHEPGGLDWLVHFVDVDMRANRVEVGVDPGHETRSLRIPVDPDRPGATDEEVRIAIEAIEDAIEGRVSVPYIVTDARRDAQLATRRPEHNTHALDLAYLDRRHMRR